MVASCTPCDASVTVSRSGNFVASIRLRSSISASLEVSMWKGRIAVESVAAEACAGSRLAAPTAADAARTARRVYGEGISDMIILLGGKKLNRAFCYASHPCQPTIELVLAMFIPRFVARYLPGADFVRAQSDEMV
jgi:hypothetical protein